MSGRKRRPKGEKVQRSEAQLVEALRQQFELLKSACLAYDAGDELQVINIATRLRVILEGPGSLMGRLHLARDLRFTDTSTHRIDPDRNVCVANLGIELLPGIGARWIPISDGWPEGHPKPTPQRFAEWWSEPIMPASEPGGLDRTARYSRQMMVLAVANMDGGAHVDNRDVDYEELTKDHFTYEIAWRTEQGETEFRAVQGNPVYVSVRQIGHEVLKTLELHLPAALRARAERLGGRSGQ